MLKRILIIFAFLSLIPVSAFADFDAGKKAYDKKDWVTAIQVLRPLAEAGDDRAMIIIANMYNDGLGVIASHTEALRLYKRAATEKNNPQAMDAVGAMYYSAIGVDENLKTALQWFHRSASLGDQIGAFFYAGILYRGNRMPPNQLAPDFYNAYKWFKIAAAESQNAAYQAVSAKLAQGIAKKMLADQVTKADKEVAGWKPSAVKDLGPVPADPPQEPAPAPVKNSVPSPQSANKPLPHSDPLSK